MTKGRTRIKRTKEWHQERHKKDRIAVPAQEQIDKIKMKFSKPRSFSSEELNQAILMQDEVKLAEMRACTVKCHAKRDRIVAALEAAPDAEARDAIMCKVTLDPDVID